VQAECGSGRLAFLNSLDGAVLGTGTAADADISIDDELLVALRDSLNGAVLSTSTALDASISNVVSHDIPSNMFDVHLRNQSQRTLILSALIGKSNSFFEK